MLTIDSLTVTKIVHAGQAWAQKLQNHIYCCTFELFISMCLILTSWMWIKTIFLEMFWKGVVKRNCGGFSFYGSWIFTRWNSWWPDTSWEFCLFTNTILYSFPDSRRNQVESLSSVILYFQSSFNYRVVNLCFERMNIVVIAFWFDPFFS